MDLFGIGPAIKAVTEVYFHGAKRSGRTTAMVESLKDGDRVVFADKSAAEHMRRLCRARGVEVEFILVPPRETYKLMQRDPSKCRTLFDHGWVEQFYRMQIEEAGREIGELQKRLSGAPVPDGVWTKWPGKYRV